MPYNEPGCRRTMTVAGSPDTVFVLRTGADSEMASILSRDEARIIAEFGQNHWTVVGIFESDGSISESEIWADAAVLAPAYRRGSSYQNAVVKLASPGSLQAFKDALTSDPRVSLKIVRETEYYAEW